VRPTIERLTFRDAERLRSVRLRALSDAPEAFSATVDEFAVRPVQSWLQELAELATFVAMANGHDIGLVQGAAHDSLVDAAYLISMWVTPEARRCGVGRALVDALVGWAKAEGRSRLFLDVGERNASAIALYERAGFRPSGETSTLPTPREHIREIQLVLTL
jgi:ribosomal protein S18 acetylase RimI-like enzyme